MGELIVYEGPPAEEPEGPEIALTPRQRRFIEEYAESGNGTQSAIRAGYSRHSAAEIAYENLRKPHIKKLLEEHRAELAAKHAISMEELILTAKSILETGASSLFTFDDEGEPNIDLSRMSLAQLRALEVNFKPASGEVEIKTPGPAAKMAALRFLAELAKSRDAESDGDDWEVRHVFEFEHNGRDEPVT